MPAFEPLHTRRLELTALRSDDAPELLALYSNPALMRLYGRPVRATRGEVEELIARAHSMASEGTGLRWALRTSANQLAGCAGLHGLGAHEGFLSYELLPAHRGHGYATEACAALLALARSWGLARVHAVAHIENVASIRLAGRLGFVEVGNVSEDGPGFVRMTLELEGSGPRLR